VLFGNIVEEFKDAFRAQHAICAVGDSRACYTCTSVRDLHPRAVITSNSVIYAVDKSDSACMYLEVVVSLVGC